METRLQENEASKQSRQVVRAITAASDGGLDKVSRSEEGERCSDKGYISSVEPKVLIVD